MQKLLRRTALAKGQAKRKAKIQEDFEYKQQLKQSNYGKKEVNSERTQAVRDERRRRRQDWELGPLSPYRNGFDRLMSTEFGTWSTKQAQMRSKPDRLQRKDWMIREGDRVVVLEGHENIKGRIGKVKEVMKEQDMLVVESLNRVDMSTPPETEGSSSIRTSEMPIPYETVRLVYPLPDLYTAVPRDVILNTLKPRQRRFDIYENKETFERWLEPQHIRIPWPEKKDPKYVDEEFDTLRVDSEQQSFLPTLLRPPMPLGIIDELRNKYGKFRDRHEEEFIAERKAEDDAAAIEKRRRTAARPKGAYNIARRRGIVVREKGRPILSDELAAQIGQHLEATGAIPGKQWRRS